MDDDREEAGFVGGPSMAFGAETQRLASNIGAQAAQAGMARVDGCWPPRPSPLLSGQVAVPATNATFMVRRVRNGWVLSDGRGLEMVATSAADACALMGQWMAAVEAPSLQRAEPAQAPGALPRGVGVGLA